MADNLQDQLYQRIREGLLAGRFQPGERLKIRDLAAEWGTSPMPVRAALQRLVAEGALEGEPDPDCDLGEEVQTVIEQRMESRGWIDLGKVRRLREWAENAEAGDDFPDWLPEWVATSEVYFETVRDACDWVLGLKGGEG